MLKLDGMSCPKQVESDKVESPQMNDDVAAALASNFGFAKVEVDDAGVGQGQTRRLRVTADGKKYMAKHLGPSAHDPKFECSLLQFLKTASIPVASNVASVQREPFVVLDGRALVLYEWAEGGVAWPAPPALAASTGRAIAQMHLASDSLSVDPIAQMYDLDRLIHRPLRLLEPFSPDKAMFRRLVDLAGELTNLIEQVATSDHAFGPIHGDIHQGNCHFTDNGDLTLIDFSLSGVGYRAYDLTGFLWPMRDRTIEDPAMAACSQAFLAGYESVRQLDAAEQAAIPAFVHARTLWESGDWIDTGTGAQNPEEAAKMAPYIVQQLESWLAD